MLRKLALFTAPIALLSANAHADEESLELAAMDSVDQVTVFGSAGGLSEVPGAITYLDADDIAKQSYTDILRTLRRVPGVNIQEEDGYGLRPNIGLRGSGSDRSARITIMEDGVPISPAPYAGPAAYYFPYAGRINSVEITKGTGAIKYGPRTTGGAINLFSTPIPEDWSAAAQFLLGSNDGRRLHAYAGGRGDLGALDGGILIETFQQSTDGFKKIDAGGDTGFDVSDYVIKAGLYTKDGAAIPQSLEFKYQRSDETSDETYLGLTRSDFSQQPDRRYNASQEDQFNSDHETFQITYNAEITSDLNFNVNAYRTEFARDWFKLEKVLGTSLSTVLNDPTTYSTEFANLVAEPGFVGTADALEIRHNAREYVAKGIQGTLSYQTRTGAIAHNLEASLRWHEDEVDRFQNFEYFQANDSDLLRTSVGAPGTDSNRIETGEALSIFVQDNIDWGRLHATLGVRIEDIELKRFDYGKADPNRTGASLSTRENSLTAVTPAFGIVYDVTDQFSVLGGVYRGFAPPSPGNSNSSEEESTNWEGGFRWANNAASIEAIGFFNDYQNLLGTCTASTGGGCVIGDQFGGGEVDVYGLELVTAVDAAQWLETPFSLPLSATYTLTQSEFKTSFSSGYGPWGNVNIGDELPFVADHQLLLTAGIEDTRWGGEVAMFYQSERRTSAGQGAIALADSLDAHTVFDVSAYIQVMENVKIRGKVENIFDEEYIASHQPAGLRPGLPRTFWIGVDLSL
ncbi:TonB-dependent receptor family protein [Hyphococcus lacteus]|uniref:TonB-dependent receptor n=1 Tax=Hyphococcus lacteus TaxID=3143536 RepID=A0ABV3Z212_9PROT